MFRSPYPFRQVNTGAMLPGGPVIREHRFEFLGKNDVEYWVTLEEFSFQLFGVKFCLKKDRKANNRFQVLTGFNNASRIVATCFAIMLGVLKKHGTASFGFIGMNAIDEAPNDSKRFRVYKKAIQNSFSPVIFEHKAYMKQSAYLILNREMLARNPKMIEEIEDTFTRYYTLPDKPA